MKAGFVPSGSRGSWIKYWENESGKIRGECGVKDCKKIASDGAHIEIVERDGIFFILPMCHMHSMQNNQKLTAKAGETVVYILESDTTPDPFCSMFLLASFSMSVILGGFILLGLIDIIIAIIQNINDIHLPVNRTV